MKDILTKENFWDEMEQKYPKAMKHFKEWIDGYKIANDWSVLFKANEKTMQIYSSTYKYHELPIAMQFGIFCEYVFTLTKEFGATVVLKEPLPTFSEETQSTVNNVFRSLEGYIL